MYHIKTLQTTLKDFFTSHGFALFSSLILAVIYFLPAVIGHHKVFLTGGDNGVLNVPALMQLGDQLRQGVFQGIDWLTHNGSSDFFLRSNFTIYNPVWMLVAYIFHPVSFHSAVSVTIGVYILLVFLSLFILQKLGKQFLFMDNKWIALLFAIIYVFSNQTSNCILLEPFYFIMMVFPLLIYAVLMASMTSSVVTLFLLSFVDFLFLWAGYLPLSVFGCLLSLLFTIYYIYHVNPTFYASKRRAVINTLIPMVIAGIITLPGYIALMKFFSIASTGDHGLVFAAYSISEHLKEFLNIISGVFTNSVPEHWVVLGMLPVVFLIFFISSLSTNAGFFKTSYSSQKNIIYFGLVLIAMSALICFGHEVHLSTIFYYVFPGIGKMHSYQRYFILCYLFFSAAIALIVEYVIENKNDRLLRKGIGFLFILLLIINLVFYIVSPQYLAKILVDSMILIELLLIVLVFTACLLFSFRGAVLTVIFAFIIIGIQYGYKIQIDSVFPTHISANINSMENTTLINFLKTHSDKKLIKYMNFSNQPYSYIPPNYPWMVHHKINLANYIGYEQHISEDNDYRKHVRFYGDVDWEWLRETGDDYIIYDATAYQKYKHEIDQFADPMIRMTLSNKDIVAKVKNNFPVYPEGNWSNINDNGYIILLSEGQKSLISSFQANAEKVTFNLQVNGNRGRLLLPMWANKNLFLKINNAKVNFHQWHDHYYADFNKGNYKIEIYYYNPLQTLFLWLMFFYCFAVILALAYKIRKLFFRK